MDSATVAALTAQIEKLTKHIEKQQREIEEARADITLLKAKVGVLEANSKILTDVCQLIVLAAFAAHILEEYGWSGELRDPFISQHNDKLAKLYDISVAETLALFRYYSFSNDQSNTSSRIDRFSTSQRRNMAAHQSEFPYELPTEQPAQVSPAPKPPADPRMLAQREKRKAAEELSIASESRGGDTENGVEAEVGVGMGDGKEGAKGSKILFELPKKST
ncbi:hypothetical protein TWF225_001335 [Orbilia oligospora]|nr:hypothetical protein TWF225_001335 [Orbilia oligospora]KAF3238696.1 hypothetical protein TWF128_011951 [Orbilia oligospora]